MDAGDSHSLGKARVCKPKSLGFAAVQNQEICAYVFFLFFFSFYFLITMLDCWHVWEKS